jgi:hypothetical protein
VTVLAELAIHLDHVGASFDRLFEGKRCVSEIAGSAL